ncbi:MAG: hypothetical protein AAF629_03800 [Chloroflexota bacterium]
MARTKEQIAEEAWTFEGEWLHVEDDATWQLLTIYKADASSATLTLKSNREDGVYDITIDSEDSKQAIASDNATSPFDGDEIFLNLERVNLLKATQAGHTLELNKIGLDDEKTEQIYQDWLEKDSFPIDDVEASKMLGRLGPQKALHILEEVFSKNKDNQQVALSVLENATPVLIQVVENGAARIWHIAENLQYDSDSDSDLEVENRLEHIRTSVSEDPVFFDQLWADSENREKILENINLSLGNSAWEIRQKAVQWIGKNAKRLPDEQVTQMRQALIDRIQEDDDFDVRRDSVTSLKTILLTSTSEPLRTERLHKDIPIIAHSVAKDEDDTVRPEAREAIYELIQGKEDDLFDHFAKNNKTVAAVLAFLNSETLEKYGADRKNKAIIIEGVLQLISPTAFYEIQEAAIRWLSDNVEHIPRGLLNEAEMILRTLGEDETVIKTREAIVERKSKNRNLYRNLLQQDDEQTQLDAVESLVKMEGESWPMRTLVQEWVLWIAFDGRNKASLIEEAADKMRTCPDAVLPLINQLNRDFQPDLNQFLGGESDKAVETEGHGDKEANSERLETKSKKHDSEKASTQSPSEGTIQSNGHNNRASIATNQARTEHRTKIQKQIEALVQQELRQNELDVYQKVVGNIVEMEWRHHQASITGKTTGLGLNNTIKSIPSDDTSKSIKANIRGAIQSELQARQLKVHRRIAKLLADMSNPIYFNEAEKEDGGKFEAIRKKMTQYALSSLAPRLPNEADPEIRRDLALVLGNLHTREAIESLARAVVGDERTRARRQELLAQYYLDPSKKQSEQAANILQGAVEEAKKTVWLLKSLNATVMAVGLGILVFGLIMALTVDGAQVAGALVSLGGFAGVIVMLIRDPLNRIQNAMSKLVQIETAFTSFIWELNLNSTYIQSQYVAQGILSDDDIGQTVKRIEDAMTTTMTQVAFYTEEGRQPFIPYITKLFPVVGSPGTKVNVYGLNLSGTAQEKIKSVEDQITVAINHMPVMAQDLALKDNVLHFTLPHDLPPNLNTENGVVWISLLLDGKETNALSFRVVEGNKE